VKVVAGVQQGKKEVNARPLRKATIYDPYNIINHFRASLRLARQSPTTQLIAVVVLCKFLTLADLTISYPRTYVSADRLPRLPYGILWRSRIGGDGSGFATQRNPDIGQSPGSNTNPK